MNDTKQFWYVVKQPDGSCQVVEFNTQQEKTPELEQWGAFNSEQEAIAKKIGLIRAGKCQPH